MQNSQVVHHRIGVGEVDDRLRLGGDQRVELVVDVEGGDELEVVGRVDRAAHLAADLALRAQHADPSYRRHVGQT